jgi:hypothetical protein
MSVGRCGCRGRVLSDGRFPVLGGVASTGVGTTSSCEELTLGENRHWEPLPPVHDTRRDFACVAVAGCIIAAGGNHIAVEVYDEVLVGRWLRLSRNLPHIDYLRWRWAGYFCRQFVTRNCNQPTSKTCVNCACATTSWTCMYTF